MNRSDFYKEVKESSICPHDFDAVYQEFCRYQDLAIDTLIAFHNICENNNIRYQLGFGSLLGAIRDGGQIPWDYDIDVIIPYEDRTRLIDALKRELSNDFYYYCPEVDKKCRHYFTNHLRISPKGFRSDRLHVDVFYVVGVPCGTDEREKFVSRLFSLLRFRYLKRIYVNDYAENAIKEKISIIINKIKLINTKTYRLDEEINKLYQKYNPVVTGKSFPVQNTYKHIYWDTGKLWDTMLTTTAFGSFRVTKFYDEVLTQLYKDYHKIFPLDSRLNELYKSFYLIKYNKRISHMNASGRYYLE